MLATDGSEYSENAARFLNRMAWRGDDSIIVLHVIFAVPFHEDRKFYYETLQAIKKECAPRILDTITDILKPVNATVSEEILEGALYECTPEHCIVTAADKAAVDVIALGGRGLKGFTSALLGSVSRSVAANSTKPVLIVKHQPEPSQNGMKVLYAVDDSEYSGVTGRVLRLFPLPDTAQITIMNVIPSGFLDIPERYVPEEDVRIKDAVVHIREKEYARSARILEQARTDLAGRFGRIDILNRVGDASQEILKAAESMHADLLVIGSRGERKLRSHLGSVSRNVLNHARCPVLICR
ncbi:MAG TPA: universal stress protein [Nitrospirota bacterium]|nr:universal stress protein [Nitrospirota bacterium]